jgi:hypothetical protein
LGAIPAVHDVFRGWPAGDDPGDLRSDRSTRSSDNGPAASTSDSSSPSWFFEHQEWDALLGAAVVENPRQVRMLELPQQLDLALETGGTPRDRKTDRGSAP